MKTYSDKKIYDETLARFLSGEMNEIEENAFMETLALTGENSTNMEMMKKQWSDIVQCKSFSEPDSGKAWNKLHDRLDSDGLLQHNRYRPERNKGKIILRVAAVLLVLIATGVIVYLNNNKESALAEKVQLNTSNENSTLIKTLNDGSVIYIAQNSLFSFPVQFSSETRNVELSGEAFFDIVSNSQKPFIIETQETIIEVIGTAFNVKTQNGAGFELLVDRGKVKVSLKSDPKSYQLVEAGEKVEVIKNNLIKSKHTIKNNWYKQRMHFKDETLQNIVNVLNRNFNTTFVIADTKTGNRKLTVTFSNETAETMTDLICLTLNLKSQNIDGSVVLSDKTTDSEPQ